VIGTTMVAAIVGASHSLFRSAAPCVEFLGFPAETEAVFWACTAHFRLHRRHLS